jgi:hypothetical protein
LVFFSIKTKIPNILLYLPVTYGNNTSDRVTLTVPSHYPTALSSYHVPYSKSTIILEYSTIIYYYLYAKK